MTLRRELRFDDLAELVAALRSAERAGPVFRAVETLSAAVIGELTKRDAEKWGRVIRELGITGQ